jgi:hypothetical protein
MWPNRLPQQFGERPFLAFVEFYRHRCAVERSAWLPLWTGIR